MCACPPTAAAGLCSAAAAPRQQSTPLQCTRRPHPQICHLALCRLAARSLHLQPPLGSGSACSGRGCLALRGMRREKGRRWVWVLVRGGGGGGCWWERDCGRWVLVGARLREVGAERQWAQMSSAALSEAWQWQPRAAHPV